MRSCPNHKLSHRATWFTAIAIVICTLNARTSSAAHMYTQAPIDKPNYTYQYTVKTSYKDVPLVGGPVKAPSSDALGFAGLNFVASSTHGTPSPDMMDCQLSVIVTAKNTHTIKNILWNEGGTWSVTQPANAVPGANQSSVAQGYFDLKVTAVGGIMLATPLVNVVPVPLTFTTPNTFQTSGSGLWAGYANLDFQSLFHLSNITQVTVGYTNLLSAQSSSAGAASITKTGLSLDPTAAVPEPASIAAFATGYMLLLRRRRA